MPWLLDEIDKYGETNEYINVRAFSDDVWETDFLKGIGADVGLMGAALVLIYIYSFFVLGSCSPVHMRVVSAMAGLFCVGLSIVAGYGIAFALGFKFSRMHGVLPFLILGLGVDDMFVIVNTIDQTPDHLPAKERFRQGLMHAGPSITITSVTDGLSFYIGAVTDAAALSSFCFFSGCCVVMLYFSFLTIFSPWFLEDMERLHDRKGDCFGMCCCKEDSIFFFKGKCLTKRQR